MKYRNKTRRIKKNKIGGEIVHNVFDKILSIGYELESSILTKLTLIGNNTLLNTDTAGKNLKYVYDETPPETNQEGGNSEEDEDDEEEDQEEDYNTNEIRKQELVQFDAYTTDSIDTSNKIADPNVSFQVLNDVTNSIFNKFLSSLCDDEAEIVIQDKKEELRMDEEYEPEEDEEEQILNEYKNQLYKFKTTDGFTYDINFATFEPKGCGIFSDIEWLFTYYKPQNSRNIILDTFINLVKNLIYHLNQLKPIPGNLMIYFSENDQQIIDDPKERILYHYPNTNLYYLQTHMVDLPFTIKDICFVPQMTFSCDIQNVSEILIALMRDTSGKIEKNKITAKKSLEILQKLDICVNKLFEAYNQESGEIIFDMNNENVKRIKNYIFMILFKIERYYNQYLVQLKTIKEKEKYFKDTLFFNSRHDNAELYKYLKIEISNHFGGNIDNTEVVNIIKDLIIQPKILKYLINKNVDKNVLNISNKLEKTNENYGNPQYSFVSYFDFFEDPLVDENVENIDNDSNENKNDWFVYSDIDSYSTRMKLTNNIVLIEVRIFSKQIRSFMSSIADDNLMRELTSGVCNKDNPDINRISINALNQFVNLYEKQNKKIRKTFKKQQSIP